MPEKVECVDANWRIFAILVILNCTKICKELGSFCCYVVLYLKKLFGMGLLICVGSAIIFRMGLLICVGSAKIFGMGLLIFVGSANIIITKVLKKLHWNRFNDLLR